MTIINNEESLNLTKEELIEVTSKVRPAAQIRILNHLGIPCKERPERQPIVSRKAYLLAMGGLETRKNRFHQEQPDYSSFN